MLYSAFSPRLINNLAAVKMIFMLYTGYRLARSDSVSVVRKRYRVTVDKSVKIVFILLIDLKLSSFLFKLVVFTEKSAQQAVSDRCALFYSATQWPSGFSVIRLPYFLVLVMLKDTGTVLCLYARLS